MLQECVSLRQTPENRLLKRPRCTTLHPRRRDMSAWRCRGFGVRLCTGRVVAARRRFNLRPPEDVRCGAPLPERLCHPLVFSGVTLLRLRGSSHIRATGLCVLSSKATAGLFPFSAAPHTGQRCSISAKSRRSVPSSTGRAFVVFKMSLPHLSSPGVSPPKRGSLVRPAQPPPAPQLPPRNASRP